MWCFTVTSDGFTVFEFTSEYVGSYGPYPAGTFKEALDGVLDVVRYAFAGFDVDVGLAYSSFDPETGFLNGVVDVSLSLKGGLMMAMMRLCPCFHPSLSLVMCVWCIVLIIGRMNCGMRCGLRMAAGVVWFGRLWRLMRVITCRWLICWLMRGRWLIRC